MRRSIKKSRQRETLVSMTPMKLAESPFAVRRMLALVSVTLAFLLAGCNTEAKRNRAQYQRLVYITATNKSLPLDQVSLELIDIGHKTTDSDLKYVSSNTGHILGYYSGTGIKSIADLESAGTIERAARGLLQIVTSPSDVIGGYKSAFSADYDPDRLSAAEQRLRTRYR